MRVDASDFFFSLGSSGGWCVQDRVTWLAGLAVLPDAVCGVRHHDPYGLQGLQVFNWTACLNNMVFAFFTTDRFFLLQEDI